MTDQKQILAAYLTEVLAERGMELDPTTLDFIHENVQLEARRPDESEEERSITQQVNSAGKHNASSFKLANIARMDTEKLLGFAHKYVGILMFDDAAKKIIYNVVGAFDRLCTRVEKVLRRAGSQGYFCHFKTAAAL
ncbi:MAG: hypothetical protein R2795_06160 [Saprospiraceae bacterium]